MSAGLIASTWSSIKSTSPIVIIFTAPEIEKVHVYDNSKITSSNAANAS